MNRHSALLFCSIVFLACSPRAARVVITPEEWDAMAPARACFAGSATVEESIEPLRDYRLQGLGATLRLPHAFVRQSGSGISQEWKAGDSTSLFIEKTDEPPAEVAGNVLVEERCTVTIARRRATVIRYRADSLRPASHSALVTAVFRPGVGMSARVVAASSASRDKALLALTRLVVD